MQNWRFMTHKDQKLEIPSFLTTTLANNTMINYALKISNHRAIFVDLLHDIANRTSKLCSIGPNGNTLGAVELSIQPTSQLAMGGVASYLI